MMSAKNTTKKVPAKRIPGAFRIFRDSITVLVRQWKFFGGILLVYVVLNLIFSQVISGSDVSTFKETLTDTDGVWGGLLSSLSTLMYIADMSGGSTSTSGVYQLFTTVIVSLAAIWALRQVYAGKSFRIRDAYYKGMYPLIPFLLVLLIVMIQILPALLGLFIYNLVSLSASATGTEMLLWGAVAMVGVAVTVFLLAVSLPALYIVCLPDMAPLAAMRSSKELVRGRRWLVARRIVLLPVLMFVLVMVFMVFVIYAVPSLSGMAFLIANAVTLLLFHSYLYRLYRELL